MTIAKTNQSSKNDSSNNSITPGSSFSTPLEVAAVAAALKGKFSVAVVDFTADDAPKKLTDSLKSTGFAVLVNSPVPNQLIQDVYSEWREFMIRLNEDYHKLQDQQKEMNDITNSNESKDDSSNTINLAKNYYFDSKTQDGYFPTAVSETAKGSHVRDLKHYYQCYFPHGRYPNQTGEVSDKAICLWNELLSLGKTLVGWIDDNMPIEIKTLIEQKIGKNVTLSECVSAEQTMMRILHYPGRIGDGRSEKERVGAVRAAAHEDINLITVLPAGSSRGLQVQSNQSGEWFEVPLVEGSIVINVGDMMQEMSDRAYISTTHRVIKIEEKEEKKNGNGTYNNSSLSFGNGDRMSTPCFIHLKKKCPMSENFGSADHYLKERLVTLGVIPPSVLDDFLKTYPGGVMPGWDPKYE